MQEAVPARSSGVPLATTASNGGTEAATRAHVVEAYGKLPLSFEPNVGQITAGGNGSAAQQTKFLSRGSGYSLFVESSEAILRLHRVARTNASSRAPAMRRFARKPNAGDSSTAPAVLDLKMVGAQTAPKVVGLDELPGKVNYLRGADPKNWRTGIPTYAKVKLEQVYPGIDLVYYGNQNQLEYDFVVAPGADPNSIRMAVSNLSSSQGSRAMAPRIDRDGDLVIATVGGEVRFHKPVVYQPAQAANGAPSRMPVDGNFRFDRGAVAFQVAAYDRGKPLVIDPVLAYSTYINNTAVDEVTG